MRAQLSGVGRVNGYKLPWARVDSVVGLCSRVDYIDAKYPLTVIGDFTTTTTIKAKVKAKAKVVPQ